MHAFFPIVLLSRCAFCLLHRLQDWNAGEENVWSCASASVLRVMILFVGVLVGQCFNVAFLQGVALCQCLGIAHGSEYVFLALLLTCAL